MIIDKDLYQHIVEIMPIACVDIAVANDEGQVLLARRANQPAIGEWWFPGGRVHYMETRVEAAARKLREECRLEAIQWVELGTFDVMVERSDQRAKSHAITTLYLAGIGAPQSFALDSQNSEADWRLPVEWQKLELHPFVQRGLTVLTEYKSMSKP